MQEAKFYVQPCIFIHVLQNKKYIIVNGRGKNIFLVINLYTVFIKMDDISVKINDDANKIEIAVDKIEVDKNDVDKIFTFDDIDDINDDKIFTFDDGRHNGKPITRIEISPNEKYLVTYSEKDRSIVGWNVEDLDKGQLELDNTVQPVKVEDEIKTLCVSDDKKLVYNYDRYYSNNGK